MLQSELAREIHSETQFTGRAPPQSARVARRGSAEIASAAPKSPQRICEPSRTNVRRAAGARLHARLRARAREVPSARPVAGRAHLLPSGCAKRWRISGRGAGSRPWFLRRSTGTERPLADLRGRAKLGHKAGDWGSLGGDRHSSRSWPRLYVAIAWPREPVWDGHYYDFGARRIAAGLGYSDGTTSWHPWCHWPVGYSGLLAGIYQIIRWRASTSPRSPTPSIGAPCSVASSSTASRATASAAAGDRGRPALLRPAPRASSSTPRSS